MVRNKFMMYQWFWLLFLLFFISCGDIPLYDGSTVFTPFTCTFDSGNYYSCLWTSIDETRTDSITTITTTDTPAPRNGAYAVRMELRYGDVPGTGNRVEFSLDETYNQNIEHFFGWSVYVPADYAFTDKWQVIGQWHDHPDLSRYEDWNGFIAMSPPLAFEMKGENFQIIRRSWTVWGAGEVLGQIPVLKGQWNDIIFHIRWSLNDTGFVKVKVNGNYITGSAANDNRAYGRNMRNAEGNYFRIGLYRDPTIQETHILYYDEIRIGSTEAEVTP